MLKQKYQPGNATAKGEMILKKHGLFSFSVVCKSGFTFISANCIRRTATKSQELKTDNRNCIKITKEKMNRQHCPNRILYIFVQYVSR